MYRSHSYDKSSSYLSGKQRVSPALALLQGGLDNTNNNAQPICHRHESSVHPLYDLDPSIKPIQRIFFSPFSLKQQQQLLPL